MQKKKTTGAETQGGGPSPAVVFSIPPHRPFLETLAQGVLARAGNDPLKLADYTILVPDRAAAAELRQAFAIQMNGQAGLLPRIETPGDIGDDELDLRLSGSRLLSEALMDMPPSVSRLERQMILAGEVLRMPGMATSLQKAVKLGGELGRLLDDAQHHDVDLSSLDALVPEAFLPAWQKTADFLKIITEFWPEYLAKNGLVDPEERKSAMIRLQAAHWQAQPPKGPVIAAGFAETGSALADLLQTVSGMPSGAIVLPGLDQGMDEASWQAMTEVHPQHAFRALLSRLGCARADVAAWEDGGAESPSRRRNANAAARRNLLREVMRPAGTADGWSHLQLQIGRAGAPRRKDGGVIDSRALTGIELVVCGTPQEEASVIALKLRESLEMEEKTVALVTADRALARRVAARLRHWKISVEDGAGLALSETPVGIFLLSTAQMAAEEWAPVPFLEALKHPLSALGRSPAALREDVAEIEERALRGPRPGPGAAGLKGTLKAAFNRASPRAGARNAELDALVLSLEEAGKPFFENMAAGKPVAFADLLDAHIRFVEALAATDSESGAARLWQGQDGVLAARFLSRLRDTAGRLPPVTGQDYADVMQGLLRDVSVPPPPSRQSAIRILTPSQARLSGADILVLGGLNDEVWPPAASENPWLSPDMLRKLGLPAAETAIGSAALDFMQMASRQQVLMTRAVRTADAPAVASAFLTRLGMVLQGAGLDSGVLDKTPLLDIHVAMHTPDAVEPIDPPAPTPPVQLRPSQLPVTAVEALMRDPYSVYARYVLKLRPQSPIDASPSASERGIFTHAALETFVKKYPDTLPDNAYDELLKIGADTFAARMDNPAVRSFWWPRFERIAAWFIRFEAERRDVARTIGTEVKGRLDIDLGDEGIFTLTTIADRIDADADGRIEIIDYKTGAVPTQKSVADGVSPQLTLEALVAISGGFEGVAAADVGRLQYWKLSGARPAAAVTEIRADVETLVIQAKDGVTSLMKAFSRADTPYLALPHPDRAPRYNNYEHLSRAGEWGTVQKSGQKTQGAKTSRRRIGPKAGGKP